LIKLTVKLGGFGWKNGGMEEWKDAFVGQGWKGGRIEYINSGMGKTFPHEQSTFLNHAVQEM
jgi:hypothetical protein